MKFSADYRALALDALRGRWKTAVLAGLIASLLGANIVSSSDRVISNMSQNANGDTPGFAGLLSTGSGGVLAVLVVCILAWAVFTVIVGGAVRLGYARFNLNLADGRDAALSDLASQKHRLWDGFCMNFLQGLYVALWSLLLFIPEVMLHVSRPVRWDSDHVTIMNDETQELMKEIVRCDALDRVHIGLDYFDASINRIGAYVIGSRATQKCLMQALLEPLAKLREYEANGQGFERLALLEESKSLPWNAVWDMFCLRNNVPFMSVKSVSDCLFEHHDFVFNFPTAMRDLNRVVMAFVDQLEA